MKMEDYEKALPDTELREAVLEANGGMPPDNWIPDAQGGAVSSELLAKRDPEADNVLTTALDAELVKLGAVSLAHS
jgi:hypothetical protein